MSTPNKVVEPAPAYCGLPANASANLKGSMAAMRRAAERARQVALQTGTDLIVFRNGQAVRLDPRQERAAAT
ncbi:hypothetical protein [Hydrogenophaga sp. BPS33]|uniref:hypothetical protein n=1 Tax=Hydrogenophaga sp. BPS33 TaxID=2651974 RepID=UPI00131F813C|nr:hypothetical protein [Hydrogenophaga sp. BPS33]QHE88573.1 hypothetical protein F9K07_28655 [Hydrogenophaga sp. BPS33]